MYATTIGRTFLKTYNCKFKTEYTAKSFFEDVFVPLFFDHHKYMMTAGNSPLENPIIRKSKFPQNPKRSVRFSGKRTKRSVQKRKARNTQKAETKVL